MIQFNDLRVVKRRGTLSKYIQMSEPKTNIIFDDFSDASKTKEEVSSVAFRG